MPTETFLMADANAQAKLNRQAAYKEQTDGMFFKVQRGEITLDEWKNAVEEIKAKHPYVTEDVVITTPDVELNITSPIGA